MFDFLTDSVSSALNKLKSKITVSKIDFSVAMEELHGLLIDSDVLLELADDLCDKIKRRVEDEKILKNISPMRKIIELMQEEIANILGERVIKLKLNQKPSNILLCGLQGSGKTTTSAKIALKLKEEKKVLLVSLDVVRPAAKEQLKILADSIGVDFFDYSMSSNDAIDISKKAIQYSKDNNYEVVIFDSAGRNSVDVNMLSELGNIHKILKPTESLLVFNATLGQQAVNITKDFTKKVPISGVIFTKVEGDARGGAILSICYMTGIPVRFFGLGEKVTDFEVFNPQRISGRILGMGDIETLMEKATGFIGGEDKVKDLEEKVKKGQFNFNDLATQFKMVSKLGGIKKVLQFIPGLNNMSLPMNVDDSVIKRNLAIIGSMTKQEKSNPKLLDGSRKQRIAKGAGVTVSSINQLLQQFNQASKVAAAIGKKGMSNFGSNDINDLINNFGHSATRNNMQAQNIRKKNKKRK